MVKKLLTVPILDFGFWKMELFFGSSPAMLGRNKSKIDNLKSPSPVPLWMGSIQNRKSKIQNRLTLDN
jgi:hypothetical protein